MHSLALNLYSYTKLVSYALAYVELYNHLAGGTNGILQFGY